MAGLLQVPQEAPEADENDPSFQKAIEFAKQALYEQGAADNISAQLKKASDKTEAAANIAYDIAAIVDERTDGAVPDELLVLFGATILEEVYDIATASGVQLEESDLADAMRMMILRFAGDQGHDTRELEKAMSAVSGKDVAKVAQEIPDDAEMEEEMV